MEAWLSKVADLSDAYLVGGAVRDLLLEKTPSDIDIVSSKPDILADKIAKATSSKNVFFRKDDRFPCWRVVRHGVPNDFIDISKIHGESIIEDLLLRDFTINAIALPILPGGILGNTIDPANGAKDLKNKIIRQTDDQVFLNDPLRLIRAFRFACQLSFQIDSETLNAISIHVNHLHKVSSERILTEWFKILNAKPCYPVITLMDDYRLLDVLFPEIKDMRGCAQNTWHHLDVWDHSMAVFNSLENIFKDIEDIFINNAQKVSAYLKKNNQYALLKFSALLHDVAKPKTKNEDPGTDRITFYDHEDLGAGMVSKIGERLRMSNQDNRYLQTIIAQHMKPVNLSKSEVRPGTRRKWFRKVGEHAVGVILLSMADVAETRGPAMDPGRKDIHWQWAVKTIDDYYDTILPELKKPNLITGNDLIEMGIDPGPEMGRLLELIRLAQDSGEIKSREEAVCFLKKIIGNK